MKSKRIGIIGAGTAGLHLALYLQKHGVKTTIFTDRPAADYRGMRLLNTIPLPIMRLPSSARPSLA